MREAPARIDALEKRIAELETQLQGSPGDQCPKCRKRAFRVEKSEPMSSGFGEFGMRLYHWKCDTCGYTDVNSQTPK